MVATVLVLVQPTCMLVIGAYGTDDDALPCPADDATEPVATHHGMTNFFFEGDDTNYIVPNTTVSHCPPPPFSPFFVIDCVASASLPLCLACHPSLYRLFFSDSTW
jgi:hypothetical protein